MMTDPAETANLVTDITEAYRRRRRAAAGRPAGPRARNLTARGVKTMLTRAGVDHSALTIRDDDTVRRNLETGAAAAVIIEGPKEARTRAYHVLFDRGLSVAPHSDHDEWSRREES
jgi:hypothetical protein